MNEKQQTKQLWKQSFNDSDEFVDLYFSRRYSDDRNMAIYQNNELVAALQMIPYTMIFHDEEINASYISGAATAMKHREKGIMTSLLEKTHKRMYDDGKDLSFLIPASDELFDYYSKRGYETIFYYLMKELSSEEIENLNVCGDDFTIWIADDIDQSIYSYFSEKMRTLECAVLHDFNDMLIVTEDIKLSGGKIAVAKENNTGKVCGVAFGVPDNKTVFIKDYQADTSEIRKALFYKLMDLFKAESVFYKYYYANDMLPYGMVRVINLEKLLSAYAKANKYGSHRILVDGDKTIPQNNGLFIIIEDEVHHFQSVHEANNCGIEDVEKCNKPIERYNIYTIVDFLFKNLNPYMNSMLD